MEDTRNQGRPENVKPKSRFFEFILGFAFVLLFFGAALLFPRKFKTFKQDAENGH